MKRAKKKTTKKAMSPALSWFLTDTDIAGDDGSTLALILCREIRHAFRLTAKVSHSLVSNSPDPYYTIDIDIGECGKYRLDMRCVRPRMKPEDYAKPHLRRQEEICMLTQRAQLLAREERP